MSSKLRIGGVSYGVGAPLLHGLEHDPEVEFVADTPKTLIDSLRRGGLDAALVSSIEALRQPGYLIVPDLCIASNGPARSVRAFRNAAARIRSVGVDHGSQTSVAMLRVYLGKGLFGAVADDPVFSTIVPTLTPDDLPHDLVMMIGDFGLNAAAQSREVFDLGALWREMTGLPFVYAVWLIPENPAARNGVSVERLVARLRQAREDSLAASVSDGTDGAIYYDMRALELEGLRRFHEEASSLDLADPTLVPRLLSDQF